MKKIIFALVGIIVFLSAQHADAQCWGQNQRYYKPQKRCQTRYQANYQRPQPCRSPEWGQSYQGGNQCRQPRRSRQWTYQYHNYYQQPVQVAYPVYQQYYQPAPMAWGNSVPDFGGNWNPYINGYQYQQNQYVSPYGQQYGWGNVPQRPNFAQLGYGVEQIIQSFGR